ncbi:MAG TPA: lanthionine synthetase LanC family protein, partial [Solirubrobacteraceae bacterium]|nr:lanthionine synthetase LanC family protein [Solirubrobacteraceae bacterium]
MARGPDGAALVDRCLGLAIDALASERLPPGLYGGVAGVGWAVAHVAGVRGDDVGDALDEVDDALLRWVERAPAAFDLTSGVAGVGVYALERLPAAAGATLLASVVEALARRAEPGPDGARWHTSPELMSPELRRDFPEGRHDLGMAHGTPGVVAVLRAACAAGAALDTARPLLADATAWLLAEAAPDDPDRSLPYWLAPGRREEAARVAWCYGDLGVAAAVGDEEAALLLARRA